jgi:hypothetical protein
LVAGTKWPSVIVLLECGLVATCVLQCLIFVLEKSASSFFYFSLFSDFNFITILAEIEKNEMDEACSAYGGEERRIQGFGGET